jgi:hypothetical protein
MCIQIYAIFATNERDQMETHNIPNIIIGWLALWFHIQEVLGSNLGPRITYPD